MRGNIENPIGAVPLGIASPVRVSAATPADCFYVLMATSEGALIRGYGRGMVRAHTRGRHTAVLSDENHSTPTFFLPSISNATAFVNGIPHQPAAMQAEAGATTSHGRLKTAACYRDGQRVIVNFGFSTWRRKL